MTSRSIRWTETAEDDLFRPVESLAEKDLPLAERALLTIRRGIEAARSFPYSHRKAADDDPFVREVVIPFGRRGYVAAFRIGKENITVLGIRHQRESDYH